MIYLLHISDLHLVTDPQWNNMKNAILYSVREKLKDISCGQKLLVITGDFHNFVQNDYMQAQQFLPQLFNAMGIEPDKDVFVIPGNHDISTPDSQKTDRTLTIEAVKHNPQMLQTGIDRLLSCYDNYIEFVKKLNIYPADCGNLPVRVHVRSWRDKLNLLHLNTTLIADGDKNDQMVDTLTATSDAIRSQLNSVNLPRIAIGHNSYFDLLHEHQNQLSAMFLQEYISAYLCGDKHKRNSVREENQIVLRNKISTITIPNIVSYKSSTDENDTYSDFGMIWHIWDEQTGRVNLEFMKWDPQDQAELQPDGNDYYCFQSPYQASPAIPVVNKDDSCWLLNDFILSRSKMDVKDFHVRNFLSGSRCEWNLAFSDRIVLREVVDELYDHAMNGGVYALVGPGGEGKTTILMQLCAKLVLEQIPTYYYRGYGALEVPDTIPDNAVFIMDNPPENMKFGRFLNIVIENGLTLILGARQNEWNLLKTSLMIPDRTVSEIPLQKLTAKESWHFAECIVNNLKCSKEKKDIKNIFQDNSYGFLYAAMLMVINNKDSLEEIACEIIKNVFERSHKALLLLAHIVLSERYGVKFFYKEHKLICDKLDISPKEANRALSREISHNGEIYQTRHTVISKLFYEELFSDSGLLSVDDIDSILENLILFYLKRYTDSYGNIKTTAWNSTMQLLGGLSQASSKIQEYLINRILDETKSEPPKTFSMLPSYIEDEEVQLLFYRQCFNREYISSAFLLKWCDLLQKNGISGSIDEPYSPAWIMRNACLKYNVGSDIWLAWAQMEVRENQIGEYEKENTARWIFREACLKYNAESKVWLAWAQMEVQENQIGEYEKENTARWIFREACLKYNADSKVWVAWAQMEAQENQVGEYEKENTTRWIFREACLNRNADSDTWLAWAQMEVRENQIGEYEKENTARWIFRESCLKYNAGSKVWLAWAQMEARENQIGEYEKENTARWIFRESCLRHNASSDTWLAWAQMEARENQVGGYEEENTARWIFREACMNRNASSDTWLAWAQMEARENRVGEYEKENTARWIFREACMNRNASSATWLAWAQMEVQANQIGEYEKENTARWIFREACMEYNADSTTWRAWAQMEVQENQIGEYEKENTARWIFQEACLKHHVGSDTWLAWAQMEAQENQVGEYEKENTARWIFQEACLKHNAGSDTWLAWAQMEVRENQIGEYEKENTARWIFQEACLKHNAGSDIWLAWAQMEAAENRVGEYERENTARWIFREACLKRNADSKVWLAWAQMEVRENQIGEYEKENTARWIFSEAVKRFPQDVLLYSPYAYMELSMRSVEKARNILRRSLQYSNFSVGRLAILEFCCGNINSEDIFCMNNLMIRMEKAISYSFGALLYLYHCCILLGRTEDIEKYHEQLLQRPEYDPSNTSVEDFIKLCREALN